MSWNFREHDQREEIASLKEQLSVQGAKFAQYEDQILKYSNDLDSARADLLETISKLRHDEDRILELESELEQRSHDYQQERLNRENAEASLSLARREQLGEATSSKELQLTIERLSHEVDAIQGDHKKTLQEKLKLVNQVKELEVELRLQKSTPPTQTSPQSRRPRSSSLSNLKVTNLERDLAEIATTFSESRAELERTKEKLSRAQGELIRMENMNCVLEKKLAESQRQLKEAQEESADKDEEIAYLQSQGGSMGQEEALMTRLEEEEEKVQLLEQELSRMSSGKGWKQSVEKMQQKLEAEMSKCQCLEQVHAELTKEKEDALDKLSEVQSTAQDLSDAVKEKDSRIKEMEKAEWALRDQLFEANSTIVQNKTAGNSGVDMGSLSQLAATISRLRDERDSSQRSLEFQQMEAAFTIKALQNKVDAMTPHNPMTTNVPRMYETSRHNLIVAGLALTLQQFQTSNDTLSNRLIELYTTNAQQEETVSALRAEVAAVSQSQQSRSAESERAICEAQARLDEESSLLQDAQLECQNLKILVTNIQSEAQDRSDELSRVIGENNSRLGSKEEEVAEGQKLLAAMQKQLDHAETEKFALEQRIAALEENLSNAQRELRDALDKSNHLTSALPPVFSSDSETRSLKEKVKELEERVLRRTEQIGLHQHDIKRLETNMRLAEERLDELSSELDMANTQKEAMLEDCSVARDERDSAKHLAEELEATLDDLMKQIAEKDAGNGALQNELESLDETLAEVDAARVSELATLVSIIIDRDLRMKSMDRHSVTLTRDYEETNARLVETEGKLHVLKESHSRALSDLSAHISEKERDGSMIAEQLQVKDAELHALREQLEAVKHENDNSVTIAKAAQEQLQASHERLASLEIESSELHEKLITANSDIERFNTYAKEAEQQLCSSNERLIELEAECSTLRERLSNFENDAEYMSDEATSLRCALERQSYEHDNAVKQLESNFAEVKSELETQVITLEKSNAKLLSQYQQSESLLNSVKLDLVKQQDDYATLSVEQQETIAALTTESDELRKRVATLVSEMTVLQGRFEEQAKNHETVTQSLRNDILIASEKINALTNSEVESTQKLDEYRLLLHQAEASKVMRESECVQLQAELDNLTGENQRAGLKCRSLEKQLTTSEQALSALQDDVAQLREQLAQSEKSGKTAEMNLLLNDTELRRTISSLRLQLSDYEKDGSKLAELRRTNEELMAQVSEMEILLQSKCTEIEDNDDKFIELLKERKKLCARVESLSKKLANLQSKFEKANKSTSPPSTRPSPSTQPPMQPKAPMRASDKTVEPLSVYRTAAPGGSTPPVRHDVVMTNAIPPSTAQRSRTSMVIPNPHTPSSQKVLDVTPGSAIGKKRRAPDDDESPVLPPAALVAEPTIPAAEPSTPRLKRQLQAIRSGFTPSRMQNLRPTLSQPSPIRKSTAFSLQSTMQDVTNSPRRIVSAQPKAKLQSRGWLGKIRGNTGNPLNLTRTSRQSSTEDLNETLNL